MNEHLSGIELYYTDHGNISGSEITILDEDSYHIIKVMRHTEGDTIFVTDGLGHIFQTSITSTAGKKVTGSIDKTLKFENRLSNMTFCLPRLKSNDRLEFALEKCVELGITRLIVFQSERTIARSSKMERWNKIALAAMKQSLRSCMPEISYLEKFDLINELDGDKFLFDQNAPEQVADYIPAIQKDTSKNYYFIFGPEGGLSDNELNSIDDAVLLQLTDNRLRSETAVVSAAVLLSNLYNIT